MITIKNYVRAKSLEEAYQLNQKASNKVIGGMLFRHSSVQRSQRPWNLHPGGVLIGLGTSPCIIILLRQRSSL